MSDDDEPQFINPPNTLKAKVNVSAGGVDLDALERAESVIAGLQDNYLEWVQDDLVSLQAAYELALKEPEKRDEHMNELFRVAHDMKGQGGSFGYQLVTAIGNLLCRFIEKIDQPSKADLQVIKIHIDAMKLVIAKRIEGDGGKQGDEIVAGLEAVTDKFLKGRGG